MTPDEKYERDPMYRNLVDAMMQFIIKAEFTPSELREAAVYAAIRVEQTRVKPMFVRKEE